MAVTYSADQVALIINTLTARNRNESAEREKPRSPAEIIPRSSTHGTDDDAAAAHNVGVCTGTEQRQDPGEKSTNNRKRRIQGRESNSRVTNLTPPPPPLKKRGPKPLADNPVSVCVSRIVSTDCYS